VLPVDVTPDTLTADFRILLAEYGMSRAATARRGMRLPFARLAVDMVVSIREFAFVIVGSVVFSIVVLGEAWSWARQRRRLIAIAVSTAVGILVWNLALNVTNASALNIDSPLLALSAQDVGSGVAAFVVTLLVLRLVTERSEPLSRSVGRPRSWAS
jgi:Na+(H+)/acetate symporter ActP